MNWSYFQKLWFWYGLVCRSGKHCSKYHVANLIDCVQKLEVSSRNFWCIGCRCLKFEVSSEYIMSVHILMWINLKIQRSDFIQQNEFDITKITILYFKCYTYKTTFYTILRFPVHTNTYQQIKRMVKICYTTFFKYFQPLLFLICVLSNSVQIRWHEATERLHEN